MSGEGFAREPLGLGGVRHGIHLLGVGARDQHGGVLQPAVGESLAINHRSRVVCQGVPLYLICPLLLIFTYSQCLPPFLPVSRMPATRIKNPFK